MNFQKDPKSRQRLLRFKWSRRQLPDFSRPWWHEGGVQGGHLRFESFATMMTVTMMVMVMKTKTTLAVRKECMKKSSSCSLGQITSSVTCAQCFQYILCDTFLGMWGNHRFCKTAMNSREKLKTFNLLFCERLEKVQPQSCVAIVRRALGTRRFHF